MKSSFTALLVGFFLLAGCDDKETASTDDKNKTAEQKSFVGIKQNKKSSLREQKTGEFFSSKMLPVSELNPETNQDIYVHLTGQVVNINDRQTWAVIQGEDVAFFAFNHAAMPIIKKEFLGRQIYLRAIIEEKPVTEQVLSDVKNNGLAPGFATDNIVVGYQLNTTKADLVSAVDEKTFMTP